MNHNHEKEFVIVDVETTGLSPSFGDRVIEIAALKIALPLMPAAETSGLAFNAREIKRVDKFSSLVKVSREISYDAFLVNGITPAMLEDAPGAEDIYPDLLVFMEGCCLIGHNVKFDIGFLKNELMLLDLSWRGGPLAYIDTIKMARALLPGLGRYSLWYLARSLGIEDIQHHRAMADVELTFKVFRSLLSIADRRDICEIDALLHWAGKNPAPEG